MSKKLIKAEFGFRLHCSELLFILIQLLLASEWSISENGGFLP